ncbi:MAG: TRAP transporter small permease subunit [Syntrophorhabdaceae bacterium]|nr:TRAP transporter small permease subunit [Syntrophorhabdaceae bacterium]MDD5244695.1 TRAP transporter small permease subunit [Syntrophorhabdaceae bacterium]
MKLVISGLVHVYNFVRDGLAVIGGFLVVAMVIYVSLSVLIRFTPFVVGWALEVAEYSLIVLTFFSAGWLLKNRGHTRIDVILDLIKDHRTRSIVEGILYIITASISLFLLILSGVVTWENYASGMLQVKVYTFPKWMLCAIIPVGFFFLFVESVKLSYSYFREANKK